MGGWQVPGEQPYIVAVTDNTVYLLLGFYGWEYLQTLRIEYDVIRGRLPFRLPLIPYLVARTCLLVFLILITFGTTPTSGGLLCLPSIIFTCLLGELALGCSSMIFTIRTWMIWRRSPWVRMLLVLLSLGHFTLLMLGVMSFKSNESNGFCNVYIDRPELNAAGLIYSMCLDLFVFVLAALGLSKQQSTSPLKKRLQTHGILYIAAAGIAYIPPVVFALLDQTSLLVIFSNCAVTISVVVSSRAVRSLFSLETDVAPRAFPAQSDNIQLTTHIAIQSSSRAGTHECAPDEPPDAASMV